MFSFPAAKHTRLPRGSQGFRTVACFLVAFYLIASCRAFVPELCATMSASVIASESESCSILSSGQRSCCSSRTARAPMDQKNPGKPVAPRDAQCPFCKLLTSAAPVPQQVILPVPMDADHGVPLALVALIRQANTVGLSQDRAPPA